MNKGTIKLYISGKLFDVREYEFKGDRKEQMKKLQKLYALRTKDHYWQVLLPQKKDNLANLTFEEKALIRKLQNKTASLTQAE